jgi:hypothetical protein
LRSPLDYIKGVIWDNTFVQDRFFGWADPALIDRIIGLTPRLFRPEFDPSIFHSTATRSWERTRFGEATVQLTFHENDPRAQLGGLNCLKIEPDTDYKDPGAHFLLEVAVNVRAHSLTDPQQVYVLRGMAARQAGAPDFDPSYIVE